jgi:hypothetical protein
LDCGNSCRWVDLRHPVSVSANRETKKYMQIPTPRPQEHIAGYILQLSYLKQEPAVS